MGSRRARESARRAARDIEVSCGRKLGPFDCCSVVQGDCLELMAALPDGCVDAVITDPPYGYQKYATDICAFDESLALLVSAYRSAAVFGYPEELVGWCVRHRLVPAEWVTWFPTNKFQGRSGNLPRSSEHIAIFGELLGVDRITRPREGSDSCRAINKSRGTVGDARLEDVWRDPSPGMAFHHAERLHPNEKPVAVMARLVALLSDEGETVLEPFAGSGTTLVAAKKLGRHFLGFEIRAEYCRIARERIAAVEAQPTLFQSSVAEQLTLQ